MFVCSLKASRMKLVGLALVFIAAAAAVIAILPKAGSAMNVNKIVAGGVEMSGIDSDEKRLELISGLGFEVTPAPVQSGEVAVPKKFDAVLEKYNELQKKQGFDLKKLRGKKVMRYTYEITSFADGTKKGTDPCYIMNRPQKVRRKI